MNMKKSIKILYEKFVGYCRELLAGLCIDVKG